MSLINPSLTNSGFLAIFLSNSSPTIVNAVALISCISAPTLVLEISVTALLNHLELICLAVQPE